MIIFGGVGCNMNTENKTETKGDEAIIAQMMDFLYGKYGNFDTERIGFSEAGWDQDYDLLHLRTEVNGSQEEFSVERHKTSDGYSFEDNYYGILVRPALEEKMAETASKFFRKCRILVFTSENYPNSFTDAGQLEQLLQKEDLYPITFFVVVSNESSSADSFTKTAEELVASWKEQNIPSVPRIILVSSEDYEKVKRTDIESLVNKMAITEYREIINR